MQEKAERRVNSVQREVEKLREQVANSDADKLEMETKMRELQKEEKLNSSKAEKNQVSNLS